MKVPCAPRPAASRATRNLRWLPGPAAMAALLLAVLPPVAPPAGAQAAGDSLYAVLYLGSGGYYVYMNDLKFAFKTLKEKGYTEQNIVVVSSSGLTYDLDGDGDNDIDRRATKAALDSVFTQLKGVVTDGDVVLFYATDHGYYGATVNDATLSTFTGASVTEEDLAANLDSLDTPQRKIKKIVVMNTCFAGGMIPELGALDYPIMIATASKAGEAANYRTDPCNAYRSCHHTAYSYWWWSAMRGKTPKDSVVTADYNGDGKVTVQEASRLATSLDEYAQVDTVPREHPMFWDTDCLVGSQTTLKGTVSLPGKILFVFRCHEPPPWRWGSWRRGIGWPSPGMRGAAAPAEEEVALWAEPEPAPGQTCLVYARVTNPGDTPLSNAQVRFYSSDPNLSLAYPQDGLNLFATETVPFLPAGGTVTVGPVPFTAPPGGNSSGEPYWTLLAVAEHDSSPPESGWLLEDDHVAASNRFGMVAQPGESRTIHLTAHNRLAFPVKALLALDDSNWPPGWTVTANPAVGDTILLDPGASTPVELTLTGYPGSASEGSVELTFSLNTTDVRECTACDDSTCGGYIGDAGGFSVKLVLEGPTSVAALLLSASITSGAVTLRWRAPDESDLPGCNVYRAEKDREAFRQINETPVSGKGELSFVDETAAPGRTYLYRIGALDNHGGELLSNVVEASLAPPPPLQAWQSYPNPFRPATEIRFSLGRGGPVSVRVFDSGGRLVRTLFEGTKPDGEHSMEWRGDSDSGAALPAGMYYCRIEGNRRVETIKLVLLR